MLKGLIAPCCAAAITRVNFNKYSFISQTQNHKIVEMLRHVQKLIINKTFANGEIPELHNNIIQIRPYKPPRVSWLHSQSLIDISP